jgi:hypothetical protein
MRTAKSPKTNGETPGTNGNPENAKAAEAIENIESDESTESAESADGSTYQFVTAWAAPTPEDAKEISEFWQRENAFNDSVDTAQRLTQVVLFARTATGEIAGVCTAVAKLPPRFGQPMYYWRAFTGHAWRSTPLITMLLKRSCAVLEAYARERDFPCIGVLLELENARFREALRKPVWWNPPFCYAGKSGRGLEIRVLYFRGARLKSPAELQKLQLPTG